MKDDDFNKPMIAIANSYTQFVPGHVHLKDMGDLVAGEIAKATATDVSGASADIYDLVQKQSFIDVYTNVGLMAVGVAFVLLLLSPLLNSRSHGIK